jgi:hypothetical protein
VPAALLPAAFAAAAAAAGTMVSEESSGIGMSTGLCEALARAVSKRTISVHLNAKRAVHNRFENKLTD